MDSRQYRAEFNKVDNPGGNAINNFYVYIWYVVETHYVFYVGKGRDRRCKRIQRRNEIFNSYYDNQECTYSIVKNNLTEEEAFEEEKKLIEHYKSIGMADANIMPGGYGGDVISHLSKERRDAFVEKMTEINKARCSTQQFKENARQRMIERYKNPENRKHQSEIQKARWNETTRKEHGEIYKRLYKSHPEIVKNRSQKLMKPCRLELNDTLIDFKSLKDAEKYLHDVLDFHTSRKTLNELLRTKNPYKSIRKTTDNVNGLKLYYTGVETIETDDNKS